MCGLTHTCVDLISGHRFRDSNQVSLPREGKEAHAFRHCEYHVDKVGKPTGVKGHLRKAVLGDRERLIDWVRRFYADTTSVQESEAECLVDRRLPAGQLWLWDNAGVVSIASRTVPVEGVVRVQLVYTPPEHRSKGYASACVASLSKQIRDEGHRCILYTDLGNPISNAIYRRIGYYVVAEGIHYRFE